MCSFYLLEQFKSTTACLMELEDVKAFGGKRDVFIVTPYHVKRLFPWGACMSRPCTENQPRFVSPKYKVARALELAVHMGCFWHDPGVLRCHTDTVNLWRWW